MSSHTPLDISYFSQETLADIKQSDGTNLLVSIMCLPTIVEAKESNNHDNSKPRHVKVVLDFLVEVVMPTRTPGTHGCMGSFNRTFTIERFYMDAIQFSLASRKAA